ncbi:MAG: hypothetical protein JWQ48_31 [Conexibacter sp.]|nr:hypothetical protein [Conexibacter sp.]
MDVPLFGQDHVDRYRGTDGEEGHDWQGTTVLLLTTTGRNSGAKRTTPLIYQRHGDDYLVVASNGGGDPPGWFLNLQDDPIVAVQVKADHHTARARVATAEEKPGLWRIMTATGAPYHEFQGRPRDPGGGPRAGLGRAAVELHHANRTPGRACHPPGGSDPAARDLNLESGVQALGLQAAAPEAAARFTPSSADEGGGTTESGSRRAEAGRQAPA